MADANPEMIVVAREARGLTQKDLANRIGVAQGTISKYESGLASVSQEDLASLSRELRFPEAFFCQTDRVYGFGSVCFYHRKRQRASVADLRRMQAQLNVFRFRATRLLRGVEIDVDNKFTYMEPDEYGTPEGAARAIRAHWGLPMGPIRNVVAAVENAGAIVQSMSFGTRHLDAISQRAPDSPPIVFVNAEIPADRLRYTLMHEVGHLVMHPGPEPDMEAQADRFAAEFLMPEREIKTSLRHLSLQSLPALKQHWKVSMAALIKRARDLDQITDRYYRTLYTRLSQHGWRLKEPVEISSELPTVFSDVLAVHFNEHAHTVQDLTNMANCDPDDFVDYLGDEDGQDGLRVVG